MNAADLDLLHEETIERVRLRMMRRASEGDVDGTRAEFQRMRDLIRERSAEQVEKMEEARGLR